MIELKNKKIGLIGLGISNLHVANYLAQHGYKVFVTEELPKEKIKEHIDKLDPKVDYECGGHSGKILDCDLVIRSPGIPRDHFLIKQIIENKIPVFTEIEFAYQILKQKTSKDPNIIAITGTNGKTTTVSLLGNICKNYKKTVVCGNIGEPFIKFIDIIDEETIIVLEVSSYQLEDIVEFKPHIGCILNITEDHLEHHKTMQNYINAKFNLFKNQDKHNFAVLNYDDENIRNSINKIKNSNIFFFSTKTYLDNGGWLDKENMQVVINTEFDKSSIKIETSLPGEHNLENITAAVCCSRIFKIPINIIEKTIKNFKGVEHRLEFVRKINDVVFINDSKSTNVDSTLVALKSFSQPIHLILGGRDKGAPYTPLIPLIEQKVKSILLIGEATEIIYNQLKDIKTCVIYKCETLENAVKKAYEIAQPGDIVLLSPACSSFDQFKNFEHRGQVFKQLVNSL
jgi:UDP-N-acetylmuramoylalanine--D-glutamate ligase